MNPLYNALNGIKQGLPASPQQQTGFPSPMNMQAAMGQLQANPLQMIRQAGYNIPEELAGNPQATVMHLIQSGQVSGPLMQRIQPMLNMMGIR